MKSPHVSPEPLPFLANLTAKSSPCSNSPMKAGNWTGKALGNLVVKKKHDEFNSVEDRRHTTSPYYKGLLFQEKISGVIAEAESTAPIPHDVQSYLPSPSPYYKGLLYTERVDQGTSTGTDTCIATLEAETAAGKPHEYLVSPYYKGLLNTPSPDRDSVATTTASSSSKTSFSIKKPQMGFFKFKAKYERPTPLVKVYSTENSNDHESLRERGSEPTSPQFSPPLQPTLPPPDPPVPPPLLILHLSHADGDGFFIRCT